MAATSKKMSSSDIQGAWNHLRDEVRAALPLEDVFRSIKGVNFRKEAGVLKGLCPFHVEKTPSFSVHPGKGLYYCFGCQSGGDLFTLLRGEYNVEYRAAVRIGAEMAGISVPDILGSYTGTTRKIRKAAPPEPENPISRVDGFTPCDMVPIPAETKKPVPDQWFRLWNPGREDDGSDRGEKSLLGKLIHEYRNADGDLLCMVARTLHGDRKSFRPIRLGDVPLEHGYHHRPHYRRLCDEDGKGLILSGATHGARRPVYGMEKMRSWIADGGTDVLIVEGEKTCDATRKLIGGLPDGAGRRWLVFSPMGGYSSAKFSDWSAFARELAQSGHPMPRFHVFPDADQPVTYKDGRTVDRQDIFARQIMTGIVQHLQNEALETAGLEMSRVIPPASVENGWDLADALDENWSPEAVHEFISTNCEAIDMSGLNLVRREDRAADLPADPGVSLTPSPFDKTEPDLSIFDAMIADQIDEEMRSGDAPENDETIVLDDIMSGAEAAPDNADEPAAEPVDGNESEIVIDDDETREDKIARDPIGAYNDYFRCLGYLNGVNYFLSLDSGQIYPFNTAAMKSTSYLHLAPLEWFENRFPSKHDLLTQRKSGVHWDAVTSAMIRKSYSTGVWNPALEVGQGARMDNNTVVFNTGKSLIVDGDTKLHLRDYHGKYVYTIGSSARTPDYQNPFPADAPEIRKLLDIIQDLDWRPENRQISAMALFGWIAVGPICGILPWRPHLWLDGPRGAGKSWIINHIVAPALGQYRFLVKSNSTESGIRNMLHARAVPLIFDEAEGEDGRDKIRMDDIIKLARHSATEGDSVVAQGTPGGQGQRHFSIASTFLLSSITPQLEAAADRSRFAKAHLAGGKELADFVRDIEGPAHDLLTQSFSDRMIARMLLRARDYTPTWRMMVEALTYHPGNRKKAFMERRIADVYGTFAAGAWLLLKEGAPADRDEAYRFIHEEFSVIEEISEFSSEVSADKDHDRVFKLVFSSEVRFESRNGGMRTERIGTLVAAACGLQLDDDVVIDPAEAAAILRNHGMRPGRGFGGGPKDRAVSACSDGETPDCLLIHKKAPPIAALLEKTPYARSYADVMKHSKLVKSGTVSVRFGALGVDKPLCVDIAKMMA